MSWRSYCFTDVFGQIFVANIWKEKNLYFKICGHFSMDCMCVCVGGWVGVTSCDKKYDCQQVAMNIYQSSWIIFYLNFILELDFQLCILKKVE